MAKFTADLQGNIDRFMSYLEKAILDSSHSASLEDSQTLRVGEVTCMVQVYERYSFFGNNRVSLNVTALGRTGADGFTVTGITSGGSQAMFLKINTVGEESFLDKFIQAVNDYAGER